MDIAEQAENQGTQESAAIQEFLEIVLLATLVYRVLMVRTETQDIAVFLVIADTQALVDTAEHQGSQAILA